MPRILPWKRREEQAPQLPGARPRLKKEDVKQSHAGIHSVPSSDSGATIKKDIETTSSISIDISAVEATAREVFMIEGIDGDDRYRMVEDEFLTTAQQFTAHLHSAEYKRLKAASELENAQMIKNISRPVVGRMTNFVKIKQERKTLAEKQRLATRKLHKGDISGDESTGTDGLDDSWQNKSLYGLLESPGERAKHLDGLPSAPLVTRAGAGYNSRPDAVSPVQTKPKPRALAPDSHHHKHEDQDILDDLDSYRVAPQPPQPGSVSSGIAALGTTELNGQLLNNYYKATENLRLDQPKTAEKTAVSDDDDMDFIARLKKRQEERGRIRGRRKSTMSKVIPNSDDIIPDFL